MSDQALMMCKRGDEEKRTKKENFLENEHHVDGSGR